jgi:hypothetical protein
VCRIYPCLGCRRPERRHGSPRASWEGAGAPLAGFAGGSKGAAALPAAALNRHRHRRPPPSVGGWILRTMLTKKIVVTFWENVEKKVGNIFKIVDKKMSARIKMLAIFLKNADEIMLVTFVKNVGQFFCLKHVATFFI